MINPIYALAVLTAVLLAVGQLLFKIGSARIDPTSLPGFLESTLLNPVLVFAVGLYGVTILIWIYVLNKLPLSIAYPVTGLAYIIVPILSYYLLGERLSPMLFLGSFLILVGISLVARSGV